MSFVVSSPLLFRSARSFRSHLQRSSPRKRKNRAFQHPLQLLVRKKFPSDAREPIRLSRTNHEPVSKQKTLFVRKKPFLWHRWIVDAFISIGFTKKMFSIRVIPNNFQNINPNRMYLRTCRRQRKFPNWPKRRRWKPFRMSSYLWLIFNCWKTNACWSFVW